MAYTGKLFYLMDRMVGDGTHDGAGLVGAFLIADLQLRGIALAADLIQFFIDLIVLVSLFLEIHSSGNTSRTAADNTDPILQIGHIIFSFAKNRMGKMITFR